MEKLRLKYRKSYLFRIAVYFLLVLLIPVATIIVLNVESQSVIKKQIILSNENTLKQVFQLLDNVAVEMRETCISVTELEEIREYAKDAGTKSEGLSFKRYKICQRLKNFTKQKFEDIFVYFPQDNYILSGIHGALSAEIYQETYYNTSSRMKQDFYDTLNSTPGYAAFHALNPWGEQTFLCISRQASVGREQENFVVCVLLDDLYLDELFCQNHAGRGGTLLMFDRNKELLLAGTKESEVPYHLDDYSGEIGHYETKLGNDHYVMQVYHSAVLGAFYAFAIPTEFFWEQLVDMRLFSMISIMACICISIVLIFVTSKRAYAPLGKMVNNLKDREEDASEQYLSEFEFLEHLFLNEQEEKRKLSQEIYENKFQLRAQFVRQLLDGSVVLEGSGDDIFQKNGILLCSDRFAAGVVRVEYVNDWDRERLDFIIENVFSEIFNRTDVGVFLVLSERTYVFLANLAVETKEANLAAMLEEGKLFLEDSYGLEMTIGYSGILEGMKEIEQAYGQAQRALQYSYIVGSGGIICYRDVEKREFSYLDSEQAMLYVLIEEYLSNNTQETAASEFVSQLFSLFLINDTVSLETMECFKFDMINAINRVGLQLGYSMKERQKNIQELLEKENLPQFEEHLSWLFMLFRQKRLEQKGSKGICFRVKEYIENHYEDSQLSLSLLGEVMGMSTSHLSKIYKENYGVSIAADITRIRLQKAKEFLKNTNVSANEIAEQTGFSNGNVFNKVFKRREGITPGRYRELVSRKS